MNAMTRCRACDREREPERLLTVTCTLHVPRCEFPVCRPTQPDRDQFPGGCFRRVVLDRSIHSLEVPA